MLPSTTTASPQPTITDAISAIDTAQQSARQQQGLMDDFVNSAEKLLVEAEQILEKAERIQDSSGTVDILISESSAKFEGIVSLTEKVSGQVQNFSMLVENLQENLRQIINILDHLQDAVTTSAEIGRQSRGGSRDRDHESSSSSVHVFGADDDEEDTTSLTSPSKIQAIISDTTKDIDSLHETVLMVYEDTQLAQEASEDLRLRISDVRGHIQNLKTDYDASGRVVEHFKQLSEHIHRLTDPIRHHRTQIEMGLEAVARLSDGSSQSKAALKRYFKKLNRERERERQPITFSQAASSKPVIVRSLLTCGIVGGIAAVLNLAVPVVAGSTPDAMALAQVLLFMGIGYLVSTISSAQAIVNAEHESVER